MRRTMMWTGAAALGVGVLALGPLRAAADDDGWFDDVLAELVDDGTLTAEQAAAVDEALTAARPDHGRWGGGPASGDHGHGPGGHGHRDHGGRGIHAGIHAGWGAPLDAAAEAIGIERSDLVEQLRDGATIADVAADNGVDVDTVIDAMVAAAEEHLDDAVASGRIDETDAQARRAELRERITEHVNEGFTGDLERRSDDETTTDSTTPTTDSTPPTTG